MNQPTAIEQATQVFAAVSFLVIGISHLLQPKAWVSYFQSLAALGTSGAFVDGFLCLNFGAIIVAFHNVWHGPALVLTLIGWAQVTKGLMRFAAPQWAVQVLGRAAQKGPWIFQLGGVFAIALSAFIWWVRFR